MAGAVVLCALRFEQRALQRHTRGIRIECCGPAAIGVRRWFDSQACPAGAVILSGLAGSLTDQCPRGTAHVITGVSAHDAEVLRPTLPLPDRSARGGRECIVVSVGQPVTTPAAKRALAQKTGAHLVDMESVAFAEAATQAKVRWAIVRGVSDGIDDELPAMSRDLVDERGRARALRIAAGVLRQPSLARDLHRLGRVSGAAMRAAARLIEAL